MCNNRIQEIIKIYRDKMKEKNKIIKGQDSSLNEEDVKKKLAQAIYFTTYFHPKNLDCEILL